MHLSVINDRNFCACNVTSLGVQSYDGLDYGDMLTGENNDRFKTVIVLGFRNGKLSVIGRIGIQLGSGVRTVAIRVELNGSVQRTEQRSCCSLDIPDIRGIDRRTGGPSVLCLGDKCLNVKRGAHAGCQLVICLRLV